MKLLSHKIERKGDHVVVKGRFRDRMRRPAEVTVQFRHIDEAETVEIANGDAAEVHGALEGLAEIAWGMGWRPRGLIGTVANIVQNFKLPPAE